MCSMCLRTLYSCCVCCGVLECRALGAVQRARAWARRRSSSGGPSALVLCYVGTSVPAGPTVVQGFGVGCVACRVVRLIPWGRFGGAPGL